MTEAEKGIQLLKNALKGELEGEGVHYTHPRDLEYIRVTSIKTFEMCPFTWAARHLLSGDGVAREERGGAAAIGTALHLICEDFLMRLHGGKEEDDLHVVEAWKAIPDDERENLTRYLDSLLEMPIERALVVEERLFHRMVDGAPPISGQIDVAGMMSAEDLLIADHKSNRTYQDSSFWRAQPQQLFYGWMARREWPEAKRVHFRIGYPNFGTFVQWETNPADDEVLKARFARDWALMLEYAEAGEWPMRINDECNWCPIKDACPEKAGAVFKLRDSFMARVGASDVFKRLQYIRDVKKIVDEMEGVLDKEARAVVLASPGGEATANGSVWSLEVGQRRKAPFIPTLNLLNSLGPNEAVAALADDIFSVKVGGLDKAAKAVPELREPLSRIVVKVPNKTATLKSRPAGLSPAPPSAASMMIAGREVALTGGEPPEQEGDPF